MPHRYSRGRSFFPFVFPIRSNSKGLVGALVELERMVLLQAVENRFELTRDLILKADHADGEGLFGCVSQAVVWIPDRARVRSDQAACAGIEHTATGVAAARHYSRRSSVR